MSVQTILNLGDDQTNNQYQIVFPGGIPGGGDSNTIVLRMDTTFAPPADTVNKYDVFYKGTKIPKTGTVTETDKSFTIEIRLDQKGNVYRDMENWRKRCYDASNGTALPEDMTRTTMLVQLTDTQEAVMMTWKFTGVKLYEITPPSMDNTNGDPSRITAGFIYADKEIV